MTPNPPTIRESAEQYLERHWQTTNDWGDWCCRCLLPWPCSDYTGARAILDALDAADQEVAGHTTRYYTGRRLVPDGAPARPNHDDAETK